LQIWFCVSQLLSNAVCLNPAEWDIDTFNPYDWLNDQTDQALENAVKAHNSLVNTQSYYERVVVMEDADATPSRVLAMMRALAPEYVIDVHVLTHGTNNEFIGYQNSRFKQSNFFGPLMSDRAAGKLFLHTVYQMNCVSGTLKDEWLALGATAVNGTGGTYLNNMPQQYFHFLESWLDSSPAGMDEASLESFEVAASYSRPVYQLIGMGNKVNSSRLIVSGPSPSTSVDDAP
jgi:hypothetical protein